MKIMTFNVRLWTRDVKRKHSDYDNWKIRMKAMHDMLVNESPDIICFQELIFPATLYIPNTYKKVGFSFHHQIYIKKKSGLTVKHSHWARFTQYVDVYSTAVSRVFRLFCIHGSWVKEKQDRMMKYVNEHKKDCQILCGDFNMTYMQMLENYDMPLSARVYCGEDMKTTFRNEDKEIDLFLTNIIKAKSFKIVYDDYDSDRMSDHYPVMIEI